MSDCSLPFLFRKQPSPDFSFQNIGDLQPSPRGRGTGKVQTGHIGNNPQVKWPANSTANNILKKYGLVQPRKRRRRTPPYTTPFLDCNQSNAVWSADYKGQFKMGNKIKCYPLTISDNYSRYLIGCWGLTRPNFAQTKPFFELAFRRYGLPAAIRTDNGQPFASRGLGGLSRLAVWFIRLGIIPERIDPGCPEQNGRHERMHRTLKEATAKPPKYVAPNGCIKWKGSLVFISESLKGNHIALRQVDNHLWEVRFNFHPLGFLDEKMGKVIR